MTSNSIGGGLQEDLQVLANPNGFKAKVNSSLQISISQKRLLGDERFQVGKSRISTFTSIKSKLQKLIKNGTIASPSAEDELSGSVPSSRRQNFQKCFNGLLAKKIDWLSLRKTCKDWIKNPLNMALVLWLSCVAISGAILFLVITGMLNKVLTKKSQRNLWFEVNNQILNALFTLMCLYQHPKRFHHLILLCRWKPNDISTLRKVYCKNGTYKPSEWFHIMVVVVLLHVNCFAQYALCGLNLGYKRSERPAIGVGICLSMAISATALASVYAVVSPLGKEYEADDNGLRLSLENRFSFASRNEEGLADVDYSPQWRGGLFDVWENLSAAYLSLFCSFCVFGRNMERLHFGNKYVHIANFLLFCVAPFLIFNLAAINIDDETVRRALGFMGISLSVFGLLYGGYWRIQMRKRYNLPPNKLCCGKPEVADCAQWLFCCWCSLAQEVRTAEYYDIVDDKYFSRRKARALNSLPHEDKATQFRSMSNSSIWGSPRLSKIWSEETKDYSSSDRQFPEMEGRQHSIMEAPVPLTIHIEH